MPKFVDESKCTTIYDYKTCATKYFKNLFYESFGQCYENSPKKGISQDTITIHVDFYGYNMTGSHAQSIIDDTNGIWNDYGINFRIKVISFHMKYKTP